MTGPSVPTMADRLLQQITHPSGMVEEQRVLATHSLGAGSKRGFELLRASWIAVIMCCLQTACDSAKEPLPSEAQQLPPVETIMDQLLAGGYGVREILEKEGAKFFPPAWVSETTPTYRIQEFFSEAHEVPIIIPADLLDISIRDGAVVGESECPLGTDDWLSHERKLLLRLSLSDQQRRELEADLEPPNAQTTMRMPTNDAEMAAMDRFFKDPNLFDYSPQLLLVVKIAKTEPTTRMRSFGEERQIENPQSVVAQGELMRVAHKFGDAPFEESR